MKVSTRTGFMPVGLLLGLTCLVTSATHRADAAELYKTDLLAYPFPWAFQEGAAGITLVGDSQLEQLAAEPDRKINLSVSQTPRMRSLHDVCREAQKRGVRTLSVAFDYFWAQYRKEFAGKPRELWPDTPRYIELIGKVAAVAREYGLGMKLSVLSPLEIGHGYQAETGEQGRWMHYRKGLRDPETGAYSVQLWRQLAWTNNKGTIGLKDAGVRVFAFRERHIPNTRYYVVDPEEIVEITPTARVEVFKGMRTGARSAKSVGSDPAQLAGYGAVRIRVHGEGMADIGPMDRVLVVQMYHTPEMDYFSDSARGYLRNLIDRYLQAGVRFNALYADEMHIQGDWTYARHHDNGEFAVRYISPGFEKRFARAYGDRYADFAKWLVYFCRGQNDTVNDLTAKTDAMHVVGGDARAIAETALFRSRYYKLLNDGVVELFADAKRYLEDRMGYPVTSRAHATWAESPTIDHVVATEGGPWVWKYEYTPRFVAANTVHQAATACHDYFKWCEFLHGTGDDTAECGWLDRDYWGFSLASSLGTINRVRNAYAAHWGMPREIRDRRSALRDAWGTWPDWGYGLVQNMDPRQVDVLMLYPMDLVAWDERFGSWMTQYAYCNHLPQAQVLEFGKVEDGGLQVGRGRYTTLVAAFAPFPDERLLAMMRQLAEQGGRVIWSGPPPRLLRDGRDARSTWEALTGVQYRALKQDGRPVPGFEVSFEGALTNVAPFTVLTDLLPDRVYPLELKAAEPVARCGHWTVGAHRTLGKGSVTTLGFRPRDDQAASLGKDVHAWFDILDALGAYPGSGPSRGIGDNTEVISRTGDLFACRFPNGAISIARHLKDVEEQWPGGFHRDAEADAKVVARLDLPDTRIDLREFRVAGHTVTYSGEGAVTFRVDEHGALIGFAGRACDRIAVDGNETRFADRRMPLVCWGPVPAEQRVDGGAIHLVRAGGQGQLRLPLPNLRNPGIIQQGARLGVPGARRPSSYEAGVLTFPIRGGTTWYYVVEGTD